MKFLKKTLLLALCSVLVFSCKKDDSTTVEVPKPRFGQKDDAGRVILSGEIKENITLSASEKYILKGFVYVMDGFTLTIEAGTVIFGDKTPTDGTRGALIIEKGAKIIAEGTATKPIVFTSSQAKGSRNYGDWGGVVLIGKAKNNQPAATKYEGGIRGEYGTNDVADDNSGVLKYVRIEFAGIALSSANNSELNGLTMYGVGNGTKIENIQVSYSGDDSYEWFGGNVNCKYLVAYRGFDDDFDTDHGFSGRVQFGLSLRDKEFADQSGSNAFESDNDANGSTVTPLTNPIFANMSVFTDNAAPSNIKKSGSGPYQSAMHLRRNTSISIFNTVIAGYPEGLRLDARTTYTNATSGGLDLRGVILANCTTPTRGVTVYSDAPANSVIDVTKTVTNQEATDFFNLAGRDNAVVALSELGTLNLNANAFNLTTPSFLPQAGSSLLSGANWTGKGTDATLEKPTYKGAFGTTDWTTGWTNFNPQNTDY